MIWKFKLAAKILAGQMPVLQWIFRKAGALRHGDMLSAPYAAGVFERHFKRFRETTGSHAPPPVTILVRQKPVTLPAPRTGRGICLELGPGESLMTIMLARAAGFERTLLVDQGHQLSPDTTSYIDFSRTLRDNGYDVPAIHGGHTIPQILQAYSGEYLTNGLQSLASLEPQFVDFSFSHAVMEHVPRRDAGEFLRQFARIGKPGGISSHFIDLKDHLGGALNHLRFNDGWWERESVYRSGAYTNRLRYSQWLGLFANTGLNFRVIEKALLPTLRPKREEMAPEFRNMEESDLLTKGFHVVLNGGSSRAPAS